MISCHYENIPLSNERVKISLLSCSIVRSFKSIHFTGLTSRLYLSLRNTSWNDHGHLDSYSYLQEGAVAQWCKPLTLRPEQSGGQGSIPVRALPLKRYDNRSRIRLCLLYSAIPALGVKNHKVTFTSDKPHLSTMKRIFLNSTQTEM